MAAEKKLPLEQFSEMAEANDDFDRVIDERQREEAMETENAIVEGRLSGFFVPDSDFKIWLKAPLETRAMRIAAREKIGYDEAVHAMKSRERSEYKRYEKYYGINLDDLSIYDMVIDSSRWNENDIVAMILLATKCVRSKIDILKGGHKAIF